MTLTEHIHTLAGNWSPVLQGVSKVFRWLLNISLGFAAGAGYFLGGVQSDYGHLKSEQVEIRAEIKQISNRQTKLETKLEAASVVRDNQFEQLKALVTQNNDKAKAAAIRRP